MTADEPDTDDPGDAVCWLHELCPECGAMPTTGPTAEQPDRCWRCGHPLTPKADPGDG